MLGQWSKNIVVEVFNSEPLEPDDTDAGSISVLEEHVGAELVTDDDCNILPYLVPEVCSCIQHPGFCNKYEFCQL